ncbi:uncharacterized protein LOC107368510 [Tetranychus urticae]|uniref:SWIM-type domain-containing protein n=1 Tax=Tetranychus urticae TaxID=32264 RepID=T1KYT2_TETUR|nr:uncharacterized protein LOC107368510 [Tetranychus urticae]
MEPNWVDNLPDANYEYMVGIRKPHFDQLRDIIGRSGIHPASGDLALYLIKLKHALPNRLLASMFRCPLADCNSKIDRVRKTLRSEFSYKYIGFNRNSRSFVMTKQTRRDIIHGLNVPKDAVFLIEDGIPYLIPNESDSLPKHLSLESLIVFSSTGHIVDVTGPAILEDINVTSNGRTPGDGSAFDGNGYDDINLNLKYRSEWLQENDVIVSNAITRGLVESFVTNDLNNYNGQNTTNTECLQPFVPKMGNFMDQSELDNLRSWIGAVRAIIRQVKHRIRSFKAIEKPCWQDRLNINSDLMNVCAMINCFQMISIPLCDDTFDPTCSPEYRRWNFSHCKPEGPSLLDEADFRQISKNQVSFPPMSREDIRDHTLQVYQVTRGYGMMRSLSCSNSFDSLNPPNIKDVFIWEPCDYQIMLKVVLSCSQFDSESTTHFWYSIRQNETRIGWMCGCDVGRLGSWCCHHVSTVFKDLGYRYHPFGPPNLAILVH